MTAQSDVLDRVQDISQVKSEINPWFIAVTVTIAAFMEFAGYVDRQCCTSLYRRWPGS